ncbi:TIGR00156 family protein [Izhakiella australiensis]|uniref:TIGR00156 family protein n=2 Tax=Izhakiella australiensis TaxID=1926881 RepID=A0A1S8YMP2_9GAMM|nr:TIGR00156 family protein [Izhakiella australiensis]
MKSLKKTAAALAIIAVTSAPLYAAQQGGFVDPNASHTQVGTQGGFAGPDGSAITAAKAGEMSDDSWVSVTGHIEKRVGDDKYIFRDNTGNLLVEIDHKRWMGQTITPQDKVQLKGKIDKDFNSVELDVKQIIKVQG